jgi:hypothetical protein
VRRDILVSINDSAWEEESLYIKQMTFLIVLRGLDQQKGELMTQGGRGGKEENPIQYLDRPKIER